MVNNKEKIKDWVKNNSKLHLIDSTAILTIGTPISAAMEVGLAGMSDEVSMNARLIAVGLYYGGLGSIVSRGRDLWRKGFKITDTAKERIQFIHDAAYLTAFNSVFNPVFYYASGSRDLKEIAIATVAAAGLSLSLGGVAGYAIDGFRDLTGLKESQRVPKSIREKDSKTKKSLAALAVAGSLALTAGIYGLTPNETEDTNINQTNYQVSNLEREVINYETK